MILEESQNGIVRELKQNHTHLVTEKLISLTLSILAHCTRNVLSNESIIRDTHSPQCE